MHLIDVFNGDADGICALHQLRLTDPADSELVTGPKRDISLLKRVEAQAGDRVTVLDIALSKNREALDTLLEAGVHVRYFDHHQPGDIPVHPHFEAHIDTDANVCTSLLVDQVLQGRQLVWAVTAAFGDNLADAARAGCLAAGLIDRPAGAIAVAGRMPQLQRLRRNARRPVLRSGRPLSPAASVCRPLRLHRRVARLSNAENRLPG